MNTSLIILYKILNFYYYVKCPMIFTYIMETILSGVIVKAVIDLRDHSVARMNGSFETASDLSGDYFILEHHGLNMGATGEAEWNPEAKRSFWLASVKGNEVKRIKEIGGTRRHAL